MDSLACQCTNRIVSHVDFSVCSIEIDMAALVTSLSEIPIERIPDVMDELNQCEVEEDALFAEVEEFTAAFERELADGGLTGAVLRLLPEPEGPVPVPAVLERTKRPLNHSKRQKGILMKWLMAHRDHPYPGDDAKAELCAKTEMSTPQLDRWFQNARCRILPKSPGRETKKGRPRKQRKVS